MKNGKIFLRILVVHIFIFLSVHLIQWILLNLFLALEVTELTNSLLHSENGLVVKPSDTQPCDTPIIAWLRIASISIVFLVDLDKLIYLHRMLCPLKSALSFSLLTAFMFSCLLYNNALQNMGI